MTQHTKNRDRGPLETAGIDPTARHLTQAALPYQPGEALAAWEIADPTTDS
jgi:hypothetical protein